LNLSDVGLCDEHLYEIATFLDESCKGLKVLHLQRNNIGLEGAMSLAQGLVDNQNLKLLNLSYNKIGSKGVILLVEAFRGNRTLRSLFLDANGIENDGSYALADMLLEKTSGLEELHIGTNMISHAGLSAIFMAVAMTNKSLKFLDVAYNFIDVGIMHQLRQLLLRNTTLKYFSISDLHRFTAQAIDGVVDSLLKNEGLKMVDFRQTSRDFFEFVTGSVQRKRTNAQQLISFRCDDHFVLKKPLPLTKTQKEQDNVPQIVKRRAPSMGQYSMENPNLRHQKVKREAQTQEMQQMIMMQGTQSSMKSPIYSV